MSRLSCCITVCSLNESGSLVYRTADSPSKAAVGGINIYSRFSGVVAETTGNMCLAITSLNQCRPSLKHPSSLKMFLLLIVSSLDVWPSLQSVTPQGCSHVHLLKGGTFLWAPFKSSHNGNQGAPQKTDKINKGKERNLHDKVSMDFFSTCVKRK